MEKEKITLLLCCIYLCVCFQLQPKFSSGKYKFCQKLLWLPDWWNGIFPALEQFLLSSSGDSSYLLLFPECLILKPLRGRGDCTAGSRCSGSHASWSLAAVQLNTWHKLSSRFSTATGSKGLDSVFSLFKTC